MMLLFNVGHLFRDRGDGARDDGSGGAFPAVATAAAGSAFTVNLLLMAAVLLAVTYYKEVVVARRKKEGVEEKEEGDCKGGEEYNLPKGPKPIPILGSLHLLGRHEIPFKAFTELAAEYGDVFSVRLGSTDCVVVNTTELRDEVLIAKANDFDGRPNFERFRKLFGGEKQHSLAFCDWDQVQATRREMLQNFTFPHSHSANWEQLEVICQEECAELVAHIGEVISDGEAAVVDIKPLIMKACANIFNRYFCASRRFDYDDDAFSRYVDNFDRIFWEVNTGRLPDFIPSLTPLALLPIYQSQQCARVVRKFVRDEIIRPRREEVADCCGDDDGDNRDQIFLDTILPYLDGTAKSPSSTSSSSSSPSDNCDASSGGGGGYQMDAESAMYALEDILGGFEAVGCMTVRILSDLADNAAAQSAVHAEAARIGDSRADGRAAHSLDNAADLHWGRAAMFETVRLTCSPIVPHRATKDSTIGGYDVKKDTVVFVNNHLMSFDERYWTEGRTEEYLPERFLKQIRDCSTGESHPRFLRPKHFKPFSHGKRSCMGYKLVENVCLVLTVAVVRAFRLSEAAKRLPVGLLGLPVEPVKMRVERRDDYYHY